MTAEIRWDMVHGMPSPHVWIDGHEIHGLVNVIIEHAAQIDKPYPILTLILQPKRLTTAQGTTDE